MLRAADRLLEELRRRIELIPPGYSWRFAVTIDTSIVGVALLSLLQRPTADWPAALGAIALAVAPFLIMVATGVTFKPALMWAGVTAATAVFLFGTSTPISGDFAPLLQVVIVGVIWGASSVPAALAVTLGAAGLLTVTSLMGRLDSLVLYLAFVAMGALVGYLMRTQAQLLVQQEQAHAALAQHAVADERRRIAREVHDVIAHSLSITLLHVTGARRELQEDREIDGAVEALEQAEKLGRQAMTDIRRTVGLLDSNPMPTAPEPGVGDIESLVADFGKAGLKVDLQTEGDVDLVSASVGLALYRITQESLTNIAKHAPDSEAAVRLSVTRRSAELAVTNRLRAVVLAGPSQGRGIAGMRQRIELLDGVIEVGPTDDEWRVRASVPLDNSGFRPPWCPIDDGIRPLWGKS